MSFLYRYKNQTRQGYRVTNTLHDKRGRKYIVGKRRTNDYFVGVGYDIGHGTWAQGYYDFNSRDSALKYAKKCAYDKKRYSFYGGKYGK